jgi:TPR repeat protein
MALTVLTLRSQAGEHRISCPLYGSLTLGSDPECNVKFEGVGILPRHCVLYRTGERTFQIIGVFAAAQFSVNGVISSELEVEAPFKFGIGGEVFDVDLAPEGEETLQEMPETELGAVADGAMTGTRPSRRGYLLKPITLKPRAGERVGGVILPTAPAPEAEAPKPPQTVSMPSQTVEAAVDTKPPAEAKPFEETKPLGEEEESSLLLVGLLVCGLMIAGVFYWPHHLDQATAAKPAVVDAPILSQEATVMACEDLLHAGAPQLAAQVLLPLAEQGDLAAMHGLALALRAAGQFGEEEMALLQQAVTGGRLEALPDFVSVVDDVENPARYTAGAFKHLLMAAKLGETSTWMPLGERYEYGNGTGQDSKKALAAYEKAQAVGDARAAVKLSARQAALDRVAAFVRSWNEVSVTTLLDHVAAGQGRFFTLDHPPMEVLLRAEEEMRNRWPLRRISVAAGAQAELETFDRLKVTQPFQFEVQRGERIARGKGVLVCMVQRDVADRWRITDAADSIEVSELLPAPEQFVVAASLHELKPAFSHAEQVEEARLGILEQMHGLDATQDFKPALTVVLNTIAAFPQETFWLLYADKVCDRMARQLFKDGKWLDATWVGPVHQLGQHGSVSALLLEGHLYAAGYGYARDPVRSVALYKQAFEAGQRRDARFYYAEALFQGRGVPQDIEKAGELALAFMRRSKHPLEAYLAAHLLWRKAEHAPALWQDVYDTLSRVAGQFPPAKNLAGMVLLNHGQTTRERRTGFAAIKAAAEEGVVEAMKSLSQCYLEGVGCEKDLHLATLWKQKAMVTEPPRRRHYTEFGE